MVNILAISALESLKHEDREPEASLGYTGTFFFFLIHAGFLPRMTAECSLTAGSCFVVIIW